MGGSIGVESSKNSSKTNGVTTDTLDPQLSGALYGNLADTKSLPSYQPYTGQMVAGFNPNQVQAQDQGRALAGSNVGGGLLDQAATAAGGAASYQPQSILGGSYSAANSGSTGINRNDVRDVNYSDIGGSDIARFMNPYEDTVVQNSLSDIDRQRARAQADNSATATKLNAYRGTGLFNARDRTDETYARQSGDTAGQLRYQGFNTALGGAQTDAARRAQIEGTNQGADLSVQGQNAAIRAQQAQDQAARTDAAKQFGLNQSFGAASANQGAAERGAGINLSGAGALGSIAGQQRSNAYQDVGLLGSIGDAIQSNDQAKLDALYGEYTKQYGGSLDKQGLINAALGLIPKTGTTTASGVQSGKSSGMSAGVSGGYPGGGK